MKILGGPISIVAAILLTTVAGQTPFDDVEGEPYLAYLLTPPRLDLSVGCVEDTLSHGYWEVSNLTFQIRADESESETLDFVLSSPAFSWQLSCSHSESESDATPCEYSDDEKELLPSQTDVRYRWVDGGSIEVTLSQEWSCPGKESDVPFEFRLSSAFSIEQDALRDKGTADRIVTEDTFWTPYTIEAPVSFTPSLEVPERPLGSANPGCHSGSSTPSWRVSNFSWGWGKRNGTEVLTGSIATFNLTHEGTGYTVRCSAGAGVIPGPTRDDDGPFLDQDPPRWRYCGVEASDEYYSPEYLPLTLVRIDGLSETIEIAQTWFCDEENGEPSQKYVGYASVGFGDLECKALEKGQSLDDYFMDGGAGYLDVDLHACAGVRDEKADGMLVQQFDLPVDAFEFQKPRPNGCLATSLNKAFWHWTVNSVKMAFQGDPPSNVSYVSYDTGISECLGTLSRETPQDCPDGTFPDDIYLAYMEVNRTSSPFTFGVSTFWECHDRSPNHPFKFQLKGMIDLPESTCTGEGSDEVCVVAGDPLGTYPVNITFWAMG